MRIERSDRGTAAAQPAATGVARIQRAECHDPEEEEFMSVEIRVPQLPESVADATLVAWRRQPGETVSRDENLADLETDKVVLEVPAPVAGVLQSVRIAPGTSVKSGELLAVIEVGAAVAAATTAATAAPAATPASVATAATATPAAAPTAAGAPAALPAPKLGPAAPRVAEEPRLP